MYRPPPLAYCVAFIAVQAGRKKLCTETALAALAYLYEANPHDEKNKSIR